MPLRRSPLAIAKFDLSVLLTEQRAADGSAAGIDGLLNTPQICLIGKLSRHWRSDSSGCWRPRLRTPSSRLAASTFFPAAERHTILREWNGTARPIPSATLPELFAAQVARTPGAIAVAFENATLTYAQLDARANQLAHHLQALGVGPEVVVGLCVERSLEMIVGLLGILKAGGAYLPLDPAYPPDRLAFMLEDAAATVLLTQSALREKLPAHAAKTVCLDADWPAVANNPTTAPPNRLRPGQHRLHYLHLGIDWRAQGRRHPAAERSSFVWCHRTSVPFRCKRCLDIIPFLRLRLFRLGDLGSPAPWRPARHNPLFAQPLTGAVLAPAGARARHRAQSDAVGFLSADAGGLRKQRRASLSHCVT